MPYDECQPPTHSLGMQRSLQWDKSPGESTRKEKLELTENQVQTAARRPHDILGAESTGSSSSDRPHYLRKPDQRVCDSNENNGEQRRQDDSDNQSEERDHDNHYHRRS